MADYSKLKVTELKDELKSRGIPLTGLRVKQQFIDKLVEHDDQGGNESQEKEEDLTTVEKPAEASSEQNDQGNIAVPTPVAPDAPMPDAKPEAPVEEEDQQKPTAQSHTPTKIEASTAPDPSTEPALQAQPDAQSKRSNSPPTITESPVVTESAEREISEDQRKRKRRSVTPVPLSEEVSIKKARALDGSPRPTRTNGFESKELEAKLQEARDDLGLPSDANTNGDTEKRTGTVTNGGAGMAKSDDLQTTSDLKVQHTSSPDPADGDSSLRDGSGGDFLESKAPRARSQYQGLVAQEAPSAPPAQNQDDDRQVAPAVHPATRSIYIRNLKRPLQVGVLRSHLEKLGSPPGASPDADIMTELFLDSIKSHAFAQFSSISVASRVRSRLHDVRWPEEAMRDPLWVDFIPDEKVKEWIEIENPNAGGGRSMAKRWEVVYEENADGGKVAVLREAGARPPPPPVASRKDSFPTQRDDNGPTTSKTFQPGVHPDRAGLVPQESHPRHPLPDHGYEGRRSLPPNARREAPPISGTGFRALDDLFPSTVAKPKLYYKPVSDGLAEARKDAFRDLFKVDRIEPGEEMKRYSFEDGERWVDKGPEFGYGRSRGRGGGVGGGFRSRGGGRFGGPRVGGRDDTFPRADRYGGGGRR